MVRATKFFVVLVGLLAIGVGLSSSMIYDLTIFAFTLQFGVLFFPFVLALKAGWVNTYGVVSGMFGGMAVNLIGCLTQHSILPEPWEFYTLVPPLVNLTLIIIVSFLTRNRSKAAPLERLYIDSSRTC
ncbi:hypothetical protein [Maridesulfovibrio bastinii]|uniref:hypothetical protein n=1 Tax=Maridesulfovibrio bastinii TaxID=47157 RepID=UPI0004034639|nr:hypothetical protein [Maridesulfovibrio bastinii]